MTSGLAYTLPLMQVVCNLVVLNTTVPINNTNSTTGSIANNSTSQIPSAIIPEDYVPHFDIGMAYKFFNESVTWKAARESCIAQGARLAVTDTHIKFEHLMGQAPLSNAIHVGIHRMYDDTEWVSATTGSSIATLPWAPGYPTGVYDCLLAGYSPRGLKNLVCTTKGAYACEVPIQQTNVAKVSVN